MAFQSSVPQDGRASYMNLKILEAKNGAKYKNNQCRKFSRRNQMVNDRAVSKGLEVATNSVWQLWQKKVAVVAALYITGDCKEGDLVLGSPAQKLH